MHSIKVFTPSNPQDIVILVSTLRYVYQAHLFKSWLKQSSI